MIGIDSNVLLRAIANDDAVQSPLARSLLGTLSAGNPGCVNVVVLAEVAWTLRHRYKRAPSDILDVVETMLASDAYAIPDRAVIGRALSVANRNRLDFADALIAELNRAAGFAPTVTFDEVAARSPAFRLVQAS